jgi:signal transduction histidine kinase
MGEALATLAHELRDPLATILLALELHSRDGDSVARRVLTMVAHQARRAVRLVDDLFDLCTGPQDRLSLHKELVELAEVVARATEATAHRLAARGHRLTVSLSSCSTNWTGPSVSCRQERF